MRKSMLVTLGFVALFLTMAMLGTVAMAQRGQNGGPGGFGGPGGPMNGSPAPRMQAVIQATDNGLFVLTGPELIKYDPVTLKQLGILRLVKKETGQGDRQHPARPMQMMRPEPAEMLLGPRVSGKQPILVVMGNRFYNIDAEKLEVAVECALPEVRVPGAHGGQKMHPSDGENGTRLAPENGGQGPDEMGPPPGGQGPDQIGPPPDGQGPDQMNTPPGGPQPGLMGEDQRENGAGPGGMGPGAGRGGNRTMGRDGRGGPEMMQMMPAPRLVLHGNTLYILRAGEITAINITEGKVTATATLPQARGRDQGGN